MTRLLFVSMAILAVGAACILLIRTWVHAPRDRRKRRGLSGTSETRPRPGGLPLESD